MYIFLWLWKDGHKNLTISYLILFEYNILTQFLKKKLDDPGNKLQLFQCKIM